MNCPHGLESINCPECAIVELGVRLHDSQKRTAALESELAQAKAQNAALQEYNNEQVKRRREAESERDGYKARCERLVVCRDILAKVNQGHFLGYAAAAKINAALAATEASA